MKPHRKLEAREEVLIHGKIPLRMVDPAYLVGGPDPAIVCVGCGCSDRDACPPNDAGETCQWVAVNKQLRVGICSRCAAMPIEQLPMFQEFMKA